MKTPATANQGRPEWWPKHWPPGPRRNKRAAILAALAKHPDLSQAKIAEKVGCTASLVTYYVREARRWAPRPATEKQRAIFTALKANPWAPRKEMARAAGVSDCYLREVLRKYERTHPSIGL